MSIQVSSHVCFQFRHEDRLKTIKLSSLTPLPYCSKHVHRTNNFETARQSAAMLHSVPSLCFSSLQLYRGLVFLSWSSLHAFSFMRSNVIPHVWTLGDSLFYPSGCFYTLLVSLRSHWEFHGTTRRFIIARKNWFLGPFPSNLVVSVPEIFGISFVKRIISSGS